MGTENCYSSETLAMEEQRIVLVYDDIGAVGHHEHVQVWFLLHPGQVGAQHVSCLQLQWVNHIWNVTRRREKLIIERASSLCCIVVVKRRLTYTLICGS